LIGENDKELVYKKIEKKDKEQLFNLIDVDYLINHILFLMSNGN